ncbi:hypothetical protein Tco_1326215 [Tanacetum coccineum]
MALTDYADADHAGCQDTRRSTSGSAQFLGDNCAKSMDYGFTYQIMALHTIAHPIKAGSYKCQLDEQWFNLTQDTFRDALQITPVDNNRAFSSPPTPDTLRQKEVGTNILWGRRKQEESNSYSLSQVLESKVDHISQQRLYSFHQDPTLHYIAYEELYYEPIGQRLSKHQRYMLPRSLKLHGQLRRRSTSQMSDQNRLRPTTSSNGANAGKVVKKRIALRV